MVEKELKLYIDKQGTRPVNKFNFQEVEVGSKNEAILFLGNRSPDWPIKEISCSLDDPECAIQYPKELKKGEIKEIYIKWSPAFERRKPLKASHLFSGRLKIGG